MRRGEARQWRNEARRGKGKVRLGKGEAFELGSGLALVLGCERYIECSPALEIRRKRTLPPGNNFKPKVWHKNNKALIKAEDLKGSSDTRRINSSDLARQSSRQMMGKFVEPVFKTDDRRRRIVQKNRGTSPT